MREIVSNPVLHDAYIYSQHLTIRYIEVISIDNHLMYVLTLFKISLNLCCRCSVQQVISQVSNSMVVSMNGERRTVYMRMISLVALTIRCKVTLSVKS